MAALTPQNTVLAGLVATYANANSTETVNISNDERVFLHVKNGGAGSINVTVTAVRTSFAAHGVGTLTISNEVIAIAAGVDKFIGPFTQAYIGTTGNVAIAYSGTTSVTAAVIRCKRPT